MIDASPIVDKCLKLLRREDVKNEVRRLTTPVLDLVLMELRPYLYVSLLLVTASFMLHVGIFWILVRGKADFGLSPALSKLSKYKV